MKLLIIAPEQIPVPPPFGGSVENCIYQIARQVSNEHQITIVSLLRNKMPRKSVMNNTTILRVSGGSKQVYLKNVLRLVKGKSFDMIQIDNRPRFAAAVRKAFPNTPISIFMHSMTFVSSPMTTRKLANEDLRNVDLIIGNSKSLQLSLKNRFPAHKEKIKFVHLGVDTDSFRPRMNSASKSFHVLFAGRLIPRKGVPTLLQAVRIARKSVPSIRLSVAGGTRSPAYKAYLKRMARNLGVPVQFKGNLSRKRMPAFYRTGDCFVCPSQKHEAFGLVNVEAMASGLPVIASRIGGIPEIVQHGRNGLLVEEFREPSAFAYNIAKLAKDSELKALLSKRAREDVLHRFSWSITATKLMGIYKAARA
ncbi:spore coat protein SA [Paenibacillus cellulosilyticus]|uniref:Spore coat protein SA n=1 Tax=Paenibacillus cellulosilyticus TaxID=375489 RepID=A0A2V2YTZ6_9BACL|nr:glycosyltransferase family 4 protein [Paenibacillus cellulosilyticus]PWV99323.1 spore coat protein SA [Paenibacillus cellulosilyticus]QKS45088.1 glycosyltransferase family 4 protein [Paenibacillus cellulosilyticus]